LFVTVALIVLAVVFALAGALKFAGAPVARQNFERWGMGDRRRLAVGAVEFALAALAVIGTGSTAVAVVAAVGALALMTGALLTHVRVRDEPKEYVPWFIVVAAAVIVLVTV
jgi:uncharacterized membrane protein HdeD (DUF308 family)